MQTLFLGTLSTLRGLVRSGDVCALYPTLVWGDWFHRGKWYKFRIVFGISTHTFMHASLGWRVKGVNLDDDEGVMKAFSEKRVTKAYIVDPHNVEH